MKTVLLLRHAKSDWSDPGLDDHDRPLAPRGRKAAARLGRALGRLGVSPEAALASTARRARDTAGAVAHAAGWACPITEDRDLYLTSPTTVLGRIREQDDAVSTLVVVGHEPVWSALAAELTGARLRLPTAGVARIDLAVERWREAAPGTGILIWLLTPKLLKKLGIGDPGS